MIIKAFVGIITFLFIRCVNTTVVHQYTDISTSTTYLTSASYNQNKSMKLEKIPFIHQYLISIKIHLKDKNIPNYSQQKQINPKTF